jgi:hypothetical protein
MQGSRAEVKQKMRDGRAKKCKAGFFFEVRRLVLPEAPGRAVGVDVGALY